ncbi:MAG: efflux RND transporter permease subunit, partial [Verrucomicrobiota bacterium]
EVLSTSKPGLSILTVEIDDSFSGDEMEDVWTDLRNKIDDARLPSGASSPMVNDDFGDVYPYVYAVRGDGYTPQELADYAEELGDEFLAIDGVGKVALNGEIEERIYLDFSSSELAERGFTPSDIANALSQQNAAVDSGEGEYGTERIQITTLGEFESVEELGNYRLSASGDARSVRVSDVCKISRINQDPIDTLSHFNGERVVSVAASMVDGGVVTKIGESIEARIAEIEKTWPVGLSIERMFYQPVYVNKSIQDFLVNLGQAFFFVIVVMWLFAGWRLAMIVGVLVPSVCLFAFAFMPSFDVELEMMSIAALIIALGILVDNAVVVAEQILNRLTAGEDRKKAVTESIGGLVIPLLAASGTTIAAFAVIAMADGGAAEFTFSLFAVVTLSLIGSWLLSITIIAMFCYYFLKPLKKDTIVGRLLSKFYNPYERLLRFMIKLRWVYPLVILVLTFVSMAGMRMVPTIFFPPNERGQFVIDFMLPQGKRVLETEAQMLQLEEWLLEKDEIKSIASWIGEGGPRWYLSLNPESANPNYGLLSVLTSTEDPNDIQRIISEINEFARETFPDARVTPKALENGPPVGDPIQIKLSGRDLETIYDLRDKIVAEIKSVAGMYDIRDDWGAWTKQMTVDPDPVRASRLSLNTQSISNAISQQYEGLTATEYREGEDMIQVVLRSSGDYRDHLDRIADLPIYGSQSGVVPLSQVADVRVEFMPGAIERVDTVRTMTIQARVRGRYSSEALAEVQPMVAALMDSPEWVSGYEIEYAGEDADSAEAQGQIFAGMPIPMACLCLILISQFNSLRRFAIILCTIPPMMIGVVPGLILTGSSFGFMTLLGLIALLGIIVNNAILLIDETNQQLQVEGQNLIDSIVAAAKSRLRPIIMTTVTTIIGLMPLAISGGGMWIPIRIFIIFLAILCKHNNFTPRECPLSTVGKGK